MAPVENAVKHGVARSSAGVDVEVVADVVDGQLRIDIVDSGDAAVDRRPAAPAWPTRAPAWRRCTATPPASTLQREAGRTRVRVTLPARTEARA